MTNFKKIVAKFSALVFYSISFCAISNTVVDANISFTKMSSILNVSDSNIYSGYTLKTANNSENATIQRAFPGKPTAPSSSNIVNYNLDTGSYTFEIFNENYYSKRGKTTTNRSASFYEVPMENQIVKSLSLDENDDILSNTTLVAPGYNSFINIQDNELVSDSKNSVSPRIIGSDDRYRIINPRTYPYFLSGGVVGLFNDGTYAEGTGFLEGPNLLVTAGHCVYDDSVGFAEEVYYFPGLNGLAGLDYDLLTRGVAISIDKSYYNDSTENYNYDWAAVELETDIGYVTGGWHGKWGNWYVNNTDVRSHGYPTSKDGQMWETAGKVTGKTGTVYKTTLDIENGQSGSAMLVWDSQHQHELVAGIVTHEVSTNNMPTYAGVTQFTSFIFHYLNSFVTSHNQVATIKPNNYGFADAYPTDDNTKNNFITHNLTSEFLFRTRRYRTGYIQSEYIVMSPIKNGITEAYIEYQFDMPVYGIEVDMAHWREYSHEWLNNDNGIAQLQTWHVKDWWNPFDSSRWVEKYNFLSDDASLPRDRTNPTTYKIDFSSPVYGFRFYSATNYEQYSTSNRGRICIGDMNVFSY